MENKKSKNASLEKKKFLFLEIGLVIVAAISLVAFEWTSQGSDDEDAEIRSKTFEMEMAPVVAQEVKKQTIVPPVALEQLVFRPVEDNVVPEQKKFTISSGTEIPVFQIPEDKEVDVVERVPFRRVEDMPLWDGKEAAHFGSYIARHLQYPESAARDNISGKVFVEFTVNANGDLVDIVVVKGIDPELDAEAVRVIRSAPRNWTPGMQRKRPVDVRFTFPITFQLY